MMATDGSNTVSAMDIAAGLQQLEDNYGAKFSKATLSTLQKAIDPLRVSLADWKAAIEFIMGRYDRRPSKNQIIDGIRAVRGEGKGAGTTVPPEKGTGECPTCKGGGVLHIEKDGYRSIAFCRCGNADRLRYFMTHNYDLENKRWYRNKIAEPPTLEAVKESGIDPADIRDGHHCQINESQDGRMERVNEILRRMYRGKKWIGKRMEEKLGVGGSQNRPPPACIPPHVAVDEIVPF